MCAPAPFQSPFSGLAAKVMIDVVVLGDAVQQPAGDVQVVADASSASAGADLELPLAGHDLGVGALDHQPGVDARLGVLLDDLAADRRGRCRRRSSTGPAGRGSRSVGEAERRAVGLEHRVLLLDAVDHLLLGVLLGDLLAARRGCWSACGFMSAALQHLAQHQDVVAAAERVGAGEDRAAARSRCARRWPARSTTRRSPRSAGSACRRRRSSSCDRSSGVGSTPSSQMYSAW